MYEDLIVILIGFTQSSPSLQEEVTDENRRKQMVIEEDINEKKNKDNGI